MLPAVVAIETSGRWCSAAVLRDERVEVRRAEVGNAHSDHLLAMVDAVLGDASIRLVDCAAVAFGAGPGSFTGLRIACAVAQGLAFGAGLAVLPVGTLDAIAHAARARAGGAHGTMLVAQDARMGEAYWALYDEGRACVMGPGLASPAALREALSGRGPVALGAGNAWTVLGDGLAGLVGRVVDVEGPDAVDIARLGRMALAAGSAVDPRDAAPIYVRNDVAQTTRQRAARAVDGVSR